MSSATKIEGLEKAESPLLKLLSIRDESIALFVDSENSVH